MSGGTGPAAAAAPTARSRRIAVGILLAIALIPLGAAVSKLIAARDLLGGTSGVAGRIDGHRHPQAFAKNAAQRWYTTIALDRGGSVEAESHALYAAAVDGDRVRVELAGSDHVVDVRLQDGTRVPIGDDRTTAIVGAVLWAALGLAIAAAALLLGRRAARLGRTDGRG